MISLMVGTSLMTLSCRKWCIDKCMYFAFQRAVRKAAAKF